MKTTKKWLLALFTIISTVCLAFGISACSASGGGGGGGGKGNGGGGGGDSLAAPVIDFDDEKPDRIVWEAVPNATRYIIYENDVQIDNVTTLYYDIEQTVEDTYKYNVQSYSTTLSKRSELSNDLYYTVSDDDGGNGGGDECTHDNFGYDDATDEQHLKYCQEDGCPESAGKLENHDYTGADPDVCKYCGHNKSTGGNGGDDECTHDNFGYDDATDEQHLKYCQEPGCPESAGTLEDHDYTGADPNVCKYCGHNKSTGGNGDGGDHHYSYRQADDDGHYRTCTTCDEVVDEYVPHDYDNDGDTLCDNCGYMRTVTTDNKYVTIGVGEKDATVPANGATLFVTFDSNVKAGGKYKLELSGGYEFNNTDVTVSNDGNEIATYKKGYFKNDIILEGIDFSKGLEITQTGDEACLVTITLTDLNLGYDYLLELGEELSLVSAAVTSLDVNVAFGNSVTDGTTYTLEIDPWAGGGTSTGTLYMYYYEYGNNTQKTKSLNPKEKTSLDFAVDKSHNLRFVYNGGSISLTTLNLTLKTPIDYSKPGSSADNPIVIEYANIIGKHPANGLSEAYFQLPYAPYGNTSTFTIKFADDVYVEINGLPVSSGDAIELEMLETKLVHVTGSPCEFEITAYSSGGGNTGGGQTTNDVYTLTYGSTLEDVWISTQSNPTTINLSGFSNGDYTLTITGSMWQDIVAVVAGSNKKLTESNGTYSCDITLNGETSIRVFATARLQFVSLTLTKKGGSTGGNTGGGSTSPKLGVGSTTVTFVPDGNSINQKLELDNVQPGRYYFSLDGFGLFQDFTDWAVVVDGRPVTLCDQQVGNRGRQEIVITADTTYITVTASVSAERTLTVKLEYIGGLDGVVDPDAGTVPGEDGKLVVNGPAVPLQISQTDFVYLPAGSNVELGKTYKISIRMATANASAAPGFQVLYGSATAERFTLTMAVNSIDYVSGEITITQFIIENGFGFIGRSSGRFNVLVKLEGEVGGSGNTGDSGNTGSQKDTSLDTEVTIDYGFFTTLDISNLKAGTYTVDFDVKDFKVNYDTIVIELFFSLEDEDNYKVTLNGSGMPYVSGTLVIPEGKTELCIRLSATSGDTKSKVGVILNWQNDNTGDSGNTGNGGNTNPNPGVNMNDGRLWVGGPAITLNVTTSKGGMSGTFVELGDNVEVGKTYKLTISSYSKSISVYWGSASADGVTFNSAKGYTQTVKITAYGLEFLPVTDSSCTIVIKLEAV